MPYVVAYVAGLIVFGGTDALWLSVMGPLVYRPALADILAPSLRLAPALVFYLCFPVGIVVFGAMPGLRSGSSVTAFAYGLLFGAIAYSTYDLTNHATLRVWTLQITILDICYGALASGIAAAAACLAMRAVSH